MVINGRRNPARIIASPRLRKLYESAKAMRKAERRMETVAATLKAWPRKGEAGK